MCVCVSYTESLFREQSDRLVGGLSECCVLTSVETTMSLMDHSFYVLISVYNTHLLGIHCVN